MTIRHDCETQGCYVKEQTPDWGFLDSAFSGRIRATDIDGCVEANGCLLILEWKGINASVTTGQEIMFKMLTQKNHITVFVINGDAKETIARHVQVWMDGKVIMDQDANNDRVRDLCIRWKEKARDNSL